MKATRLALEWVVLLGLAVLGAVLLQSSGTTHRLDNQLLDSLTAFVTPEFEDEFVLVAIDNRSLDEVGAWPWPRSRHAQLVERLDEAGARAILLDILFIEPTDPAEDEALAEAMSEAGNVLLSHTFIDRSNAQTGTDPLYPLPILREAAAGVGHVAADPDDDGILRRFDLAFETDRGTYPHVALEAMRVLGEEVPVDPSGEDPLVPFQGADAIKVQPAADIISGAFLPEIIEGKIVLVGATADGMGDRYSVASDDIGLMTGVEMQANLLNGLRQDALVKPVGPVWQNALAITALVALFASFWFLPPRPGLYVAIGLVGALLLASILLLVLGRMWLPAAPAIVMILLAYPLWNWRRLSHVSRYLDREAARMRGDRPAQPHEGMEYVARQVERVRSLIHSIRDRLSFLRQVIETAPDAMVVAGEDGRVRMLNEKAGRLFPGWETLGEPTLDQLFDFGGAQLQRSGSELATADGRTFLVARAAIDPGEEPDFAGEILALREITDLRRLDQERKQMLEFLSHDMRTPQVAIIGLTRKNAEHIGGVDTMSRIRKQADRTLKLADDFVQLARLESPDLQIEDTDLGALIEEACDRAYVLAEARHIAIEQDLPQDPCFADVDPSLIARMLDNLIGNAVKYSPENSVIEVGLECSQGRAPQITVADNGEGLPEARLADPFARFGAHATHAGPSAGLGLALVKKVVDAHGGTIAVASRAGEGTRFTVTLPS